MFSGTSCPPRAAAIWNAGRHRRRSLRPRPACATWNAPRSERSVSRRTPLHAAKVRDQASHSPLGWPPPFKALVCQQKESLFPAHGRSNYALGMECARAACAPSQRGRIVVSARWGPARWHIADADASHYGRSALHNQFDSAFIVATLSRRSALALPRTPARRVPRRRCPDSGGISSMTRYTAR